MYLGVGVLAFVGTMVLIITAHFIFRNKKDKSRILLFLEMNVVRTSLVVGTIAALTWGFLKGWQ